MTILLVRHGETIDNASQIFQMPKSPLSRNGNKQAEQLSQRLAQAKITDIICSDYLRTKETASFTVSLVGTDPTYSPLLRERNFGDLRGRRYADLSFDPFDLDYQPINGENWEDFNQRMVDAWELIRSAALEAQGDLLVVTHGFVCRALVANHALLENSIEMPTHWGNTSVTEIDSLAPWKVRKLNCTAHLGNQETDQRALLGQV